MSKLFSLGMEAFNSFGSMARMTRDSVHRKAQLLGSAFLMIED